MKMNKKKSMDKKTISQSNLFENDNNNKNQHLKLRKINHVPLSYHPLDHVRVTLRFEMNETKIMK